MKSRQRKRKKLTCKHRVFKETLLLVQFKYHHDKFIALKVISTDDNQLSTFKRGCFLSSDKYAPLRDICLYGRNGRGERRLDLLYEKFIEGKINILVFTHNVKWRFRGYLKGNCETLIQQVINASQPELLGYLDTGVETANNFTYKRYLP